MIEILVVDTQESTNRMLSISSNGHGPADVCAAVSAIIQSAAGFLKELKDGMVNEMDMVILKSGGTFIADAKLIPNEPGLQIVFDTVAHMLCYGLLAVQQSDPDALDVEMIMNMDELVTLQEKMDCIQEWRRAHDIDPGNMKPPDFVEI
jgi:uncharacterized protein YsxB (DUF464 family)